MLKEKKLKFYNAKNYLEIPQLHSLSDEEQFNISVVSSVLPFRTNNYVTEELIDWSNIPNDPIYQLTFPQKGMLKEEHFNKIANAIKSGKSTNEISSVANSIRFELNPHPAGQMSANAAILDGEVVRGLQHKYKETVLVFPSSGQTCHAYCTFCFRWAQFVGINDLKFATDESKRFQEYLKRHKEVTDVLFTGGDPMVMSSKKLSIYIEPLLAPEFDHIKNIRIGTKSLSYWPYRYVTDNDADEILRLFEKIVKSEKHLAIMAHFNHWKELSTNILKEAVRRIRSTGAVIRTQSPLINHINNNPKVWSKMWKEQVKLGMIPYYFFVERDTGAKEYFAVPLVRAFEVYRNAFTEVSGLIRTVRGPSMSALPGKIAIDGITEIYGEKVFALNFIQARNPDWVKQPFFAKFDKNATWLNDLKPAFGKSKFFYEDELEEILNAASKSVIKEENNEEILAG
jgi:KamA family protein